MIPWLHADAEFPDTRRALGSNTDAPGLLAAGGDLSIGRLEKAYRRGIFPWFGEGQPILWWSTEPRMVLPVAEFKVSRSLRKTLQRFRQTPGCEVRFDTQFNAVMQHCALTPRDDQPGTWIVPEIRAAYAEWHLKGVVHSVETWMQGELVGGLYGINIGRMFFGESMFAHRTDASKIALAALVCFCRKHALPVIDCQQETAHLSSLGARPWDRDRFENHLKQAIDAPGPQDWTYHESFWDQLIPK
jgi:leucyl/phenylalanyl-tRNA--protein transferase